ncbi:polysaccharide pyruvyl transferase family protein [Endothiovibrio diazotrophicus]
MKRIGLLDNLPGLAAYRRDGFIEGSAAALNVAVGGNSGNLAYVFGIERMLGNPLEPATWAWPAEAMRKQFDHLVVCCANQLGAHVDLAGWADRLRDFDLPVTLIGLGAQADDYHEVPEIPAGTRELLDVVGRLREAPARPNIAVRGGFTGELLARLGVECAVTGCPSLMISARPALGAELVANQRPGPFERVASAAGNPWHARSAPLERMLVDLVEFRDGAYLLQHPLAMFQLALGEGARLDADTVHLLLQTYGGRFDAPGLERWFVQHAHLFLDVPHWMRFLRHFDAVVGPRYHGVALAIQAGVPGCVVSIDARTRELCAETAVKALWVDDALRLNPLQLAEAARWSTADGAHFDRVRQARAGHHRDFLRDNGLTPSPHLERLAEPAAA